MRLRNFNDGVRWEAPGNLTFLTDTDGFSELSLLSESDLVNWIDATSPSASISIGSSKGTPLLLPFVAVAEVLV